jgi:hypothetical protein
MLRDEKFKDEIVSLAGKDTKPESTEGGAGKKVMDSAAAAQVRASINSSLEDVKKRGKLTHKEAMEIMVSFAILLRLAECFAWFLKCLAPCNCSLRAMCRGCRVGMRHTRIRWAVSGGCYRTWLFIIVVFVVCGRSPRRT